MHVLSINKNKILLDATFTFVLPPIIFRTWLTQVNGFDSWIFYYDGQPRKISNCKSYIRKKHCHHLLQIEMNCWHHRRWVSKCAKRGLWGQHVWTETRWEQNCWRVKIVFRSKWCIGKYFYLWIAKNNGK